MRLEARLFRITPLTLALFALALSLPSSSAAAEPFAVGDSVEAFISRDDAWKKATITVVHGGDLYGVRLENGDERVVSVHQLKLLAHGGGAPVPRPPAAAPPAATTPPQPRPAQPQGDRTVAADRPIQKCPVEQKPAKNGDAPDPELLKQLVRCKKGEQPAAPGLDGAVTVEIASLKIGEPRKWDPRRDMGSGKLGTVVYPVKVQYSHRTHYRTRIEVEQDWIRVMNFFVNSFGEWDSGLEENVKSPEMRSIPR